MWFGGRGARSRGAWGGGGCGAAPGYTLFMRAVGCLPAPFDARAGPRWPCPCCCAVAGSGWHAYPLQRARALSFWRVPPIWDLRLPFQLVPCLLKRLLPSGLVPQRRSVPRPASGHGTPHIHVAAGDPRPLAWHGPPRPLPPPHHAHTPSKTTIQQAATRTRRSRQRPCAPWRRCSTTSPASRCGTHYDAGAHDRGRAGQGSRGSVVRASCPPVHSPCLP